MMEENLLQEKKEKARVGRRSAILFDNEWNKQIFDKAAKMMLDNYYDYSPENTKKNIVLSGTFRMGKTLFWACIHLICRKSKLINNGELTHNLEPFVEHLTEIFGKEVIGDRTAIQKKEQLLVYYEANRCYKIREYETEAEQKNADKYYKLFRTVNKCWDDAIKQINLCTFAT